MNKNDMYFARFLYRIIMLADDLKQLKAYAKILGNSEIGSYKGEV